MSALAALGSTLMAPEMAPLTQESGAQSESHPNPGASEQNTDFEPITAGDKAGASILTILACVSVVGAMVWIVLD
jgi:mannan endo-1,6-alpha-mannosidase